MRLRTYGLQGRTAINTLPLTSIASSKSTATCLPPGLQKLLPGITLTPGLSVDIGCQLEPSHLQQWGGSWGKLVSSLHLHRGSRSRRAQRTLTKAKGSELELS